MLSVFCFVSEKLHLQTEKDFLQFLCEYNNIQLFVTLYLNKLEVVLKIKHLMKKVI